ncbi:hypothetical protein [Mycolicibacterium llatzerense]|uniref:hypothetical protein n=1 Tax=Mycolicibacterium llatzerense TaxID=280871 RepID=UPI0021B50AAA|nr:hypothetical protein [Mycolicibacterium llatzerense]MCT7368374.1 hypothetical protein [Mycolicibacterium llatzerense]
MDPAVHEGRDGHRLRWVRDGVAERDRLVVDGRLTVLGSQRARADHVVVGVQVVECTAEIVVRTVVRIIARRLVVKPVVWMVGRQRQSW